MNIRLDIVDYSSSRINAHLKLLLYPENRKYIPRILSGKKKLLKM